MLEIADSYDRLAKRSEDLVRRRAGRSEPTSSSCSCRTDAPHGVENPDPSVEALIYLIVERG